MRHKVGSAISDFSMIGHGDRVIVAISGGKDSIVLIKVLSDLSRAAPVDYEVIPVHVSTGYELGFDQIALWIRNQFALEVIRIDSRISEIVGAVSDPQKSPCALCSRLRRGRLYAYAQEIGADSIALGHHMDDIIETFLLRCFYTGQIGAMAPSRYSDDGENRVIRPLAYCTTELVNEYFDHLHIDAVESSCPVRPDGKREMIRGYLSRLEEDIPRVRFSIFGALGNIDEKSLCMKEAARAHPH
ncbi:MAG: ATP-binding protein [Desulfomonilia bacterium]